MADNQTNVQTSVQQVDIDLDSLFAGAPGVDNLITPTSDSTNDGKNKPNIFSSTKTDLNFLDQDDEEEEEQNVSRGTSQVLNEIINDIDDDNEDVLNKPGRPKTEKSGLVEFLKKRIESNEMFAFDDYDEKKQSLDDYLAGLTEKDVEELWQANVDNLKNEVASKTPQEFFSSLPQELQYAAKYVADGGQDLKGLFQALAQVEQVREMDAEDPNDQEFIVRQYMQAKGFPPETIDEDIETWKDLNSLGKKAKQYKPLLDNMQEKIVQAKIEKQEALQLQQQEAAENYIQNVFEALKPAEINGLKLDKRTQAQLYSGLTQYAYPSISGRPTNQLGHLLEKYQFVEPDYSLIAEALWLLSNPNEYRQSLMKQGKNQAVEQTVKQLKTEQARKISSTYEEEEPRSRKITRPTNIFKR
jgi:hypothetical protein